MKIYLDLQKQAITKTTDENIYQGDIYSNAFEILFYNYTDSNWFPTMSQLAPNGRKAGEFTADALDVGESHEYTEDGVTYLKFTFTMGTSWVLMKGRSEFYIWFNRLGGAIVQKKCVGVVNIMIDHSTEDYFIADPTFNPNVKAYIDACIAELGDGSPKYFDTASNIANCTEDKGLAVATDTGHLYYWDETKNSTTKYTDSGLVYNDLSNYYTKTQADALLVLKADKSNVYTKTEVNNITNDLSARITANADDIDTLEGNVTTLQDDVADLKSVQNVVDVVATKSALQSYDTSKLETNDKIQVITDESHDSASTIYNWNGSAWQYVGAFGTNSYTKQESDNRFAPKSTAITHTGNQLQDYSGNNIYPNLDDGQIKILKLNNELQTFIGSYPTMNYEQGSIFGGNEADNPTRIRSDYIYPRASNLLSIFTTDGYWYSIIEYDYNMNFISESSEWQKTSQTISITQNHRYRIVCRREDNANIAVSEGTNVYVLLSDKELIKANQNTLDYIFNDENVLTWEMGALANGVELFNNTRIRSVGYNQFVAKKITISVPSGFKCSFTEFYPDKSFYRQGATWENEYIIDCNPINYYRFVMRRDDNANLKTLQGELFYIEVDGIYDVVRDLYPNHNYAIESNFTPSKMRFAGHRGAMEYYPENTIASFTKACELGVWGVETDIRFTSDDVAVCLHDASIDRTTNGIGNVASMTFSQLEQYDIDYGDVYGTYTGGDLKVPKFEDFLKICHRYGKVALVHLQDLGNEYNQKVYNIVKKCGMLNSAIFQSWNINDIKYLKSIDKNIFGCSAYNSITQSQIDELYSLGGSLGFHINTSNGITDELIQYAKSKNMYIFVDPSSTVEGVETWISKFVDVGTATYISILEPYL